MESFITYIVYCRPSRDSLESSSTIRTDGSRDDLPYRDFEEIDDDFGGFKVPDLTVSCYDIECIKLLSLKIFLKYFIAYIEVNFY